MSNIPFQKYLKSLGYNVSKNIGREFCYEINLQSNQKRNILFYYLPETLIRNDEIFGLHQDLWNKNETQYFIIVTERETVIYNAKVKPLKDNINYGSVYKLDFGISNFDNLTENVINKTKVDTGQFFKFVEAKKKKNREQEVDKDLLLNLLALKKDLRGFKLDNNIIHLIILRCLFLKYLEDRNVLDNKNLAKILESGNAEKLLAAFDEMKKINGDIFKDDNLTNVIIEPLLPFLARFFTSDYLTKQLRLFPYKFDKIPVQLLSHVYEAFLKKDNKKQNGIFYTPSFLANFMLSFSLVPLLKKRNDVTVLDPSCGSGAFLVESFRYIINKNKANQSFEKKKEILENQIFGIDLDENALQIATFSLYLVLLEDISAAFIREQIRNASPILPTLIGKSLISGNTLTNDTIFENDTFDCIVGNPPWASVENNDDESNKITRAAIGGKGKEGTKGIYRNVSDYQLSQAFLIRIQRWGSDETIYSMVVNSSIFFNKEAILFRQNDLIVNYDINYFFELSSLNKILFKKKSIGKVGLETIEIGANEPCTVLVFSNKLNENNLVKYITPQLTPISEYLNLIHYTDNDVKEVKQTDFTLDDLIWVILSKGNWEDYKLIKQILYLKSSYKIICNVGFQPKKTNERIASETNFRTLIRVEDFRRFYRKSNLIEFDWNKKVHRRRDEGLYEGNKILISRSPLKKDLVRLKAIYESDNLLFKDDIMCLKTKHEYPNYVALLGIINSSLIGFFVYLTSIQWKSDISRRTTLRVEDIEAIKIPEVDNLNILTEIEALVNIIEDNTGINTETIETQIDELVYDLYSLLDYEKEIIREFYQINVERKGGGKEKVNFEDVKSYVEKFKSVFRLILSDDLGIQISYKISPNLGTILKIEFVSLEMETEDIGKLSTSDSDILHVIQQEQLTDAFYHNRLCEGKTKVYTENAFYLLKSNYFKDWTIRQAVKDANEEVKLIIKDLPHD